MTTGVRVVSEGPARPLPTSLSGNGGVVDGSNQDWEDGAPPPGGIGGGTTRDQWKQPVRAASTANVTLATLAAGDTLDGVTLAAGDRILLKDQTTGAEKGIYVVGDGAGATLRAIDMDEADEVMGAIVYVIAGTANTGTAWAVTNTTQPTIDTDAITWAAFGGGGGSALTIKDEGTPLATAATSLDFVGSAVVASGAGAAKTITITQPTLPNAAEDGSNVITAPTSFDFRHGLDVTSSAGTARVAVDESELDHSALGGTKTHAADTIAPTNLDIPSTASPAQTAEGRAVWDSDDDRLTIGTGAARKTFIGDPASCLNVPINGRGSVIGTGIANFAIRIKGTYTLTGWAVYTDLSGAATIDIWKVAHASYPPTVANTIIGGGGTKPSSGSARKNSGSPTSWASTTLSDGDVLIFNVDSNATNTWITVALDLQRTG